MQEKEKTDKFSQRIDDMYQLGPTSRDFVSFTFSVAISTVMKYEGKDAEFSVHLFIITNSAIPLFFFNTVLFIATCDV